MSLSYSQAPVPPRSRSRSREPGGGFFNPLAPQSNQGLSSSSSSRGGGGNFNGQQQYQQTMTMSSSQSQNNNQTQNSSSSSSEQSNIRVVVRIRPALKREKQSRAFRTVCFAGTPNENGQGTQASTKCVTLAEIVPSTNSVSDNQNQYEDNHNINQLQVDDSLTVTNHVFHFDHVHGPNDDQQQVYETTGRLATKALLRGYNSSVLAYGQTSTGKTYTMEGPLDLKSSSQQLQTTQVTDSSESTQGIIARCVDDVFHAISTCPNEKAKFLVRASYLQIYNEQCSDLLNQNNANGSSNNNQNGSGPPGANIRDNDLDSFNNGWNRASSSRNDHGMIPNLRSNNNNHNGLNDEGQSLVIREDRRRGVYVEGLSEWVVRNSREVYQLLDRGGEERVIAQTKSNDVSSRSHTVFTIILEQTEDGGQDGDANGPPSKQRKKLAKLHLVDLAGSERVHWTGAKGTQLEESKKINTSLLALGNVISALSQQSQSMNQNGSSSNTHNSSRIRSHVPYRDSKLTRLLEDALGGNCVTTVIAMLSPAYDAFHESLSTLKFANRAKSIINIPEMNQIGSQSQNDSNNSHIHYEREISRLRGLLSQTQSENGNLLNQVCQINKPQALDSAEEQGKASLLMMELLEERERRRAAERRLSELESQNISGDPQTNLAELLQARRALHQNVLNGTNHHVNVTNSPGDRSTTHSQITNNSTSIANTITAANGVLNLPQGLSGTPNSTNGVAVINSQSGASHGLNTNNNLAGGTTTPQSQSVVSVGTQNVNSNTERYKALLLKQRDIMRTFITRLKERDDSISSLETSNETLNAQCQLLSQQLREKENQVMQMGMQLSQISQTQQMSQTQSQVQSLNHNNDQLVEVVDDNGRVINVTVANGVLLNTESLGTQTQQLNQSSSNTTNNPNSNQNNWQNELKGYVSRLSHIQSQIGDEKAKQELGNQLQNLVALVNNNASQLQNINQNQNQSSIIESQDIDDGTLQQRVHFQDEDVLQAQTQQTQQTVTMGVNTQQNQIQIQQPLTPAQLQQQYQQQQMISQGLSPLAAQRAARSQSQSRNPSQLPSQLPSQMNSRPISQVHTPNHYNSLNGLSQNQINSVPNVVAFGGFANPYYKNVVDHIQNQNQNSNSNSGDTNSMILNQNLNLNSNQNPNFNQMTMPNQNLNGPMNQMNAMNYNPLIRSKSVPGDYYSHGRIRGTLVANKKSHRGMSPGIGRLR